MFDGEIKVINSKSHFGKVPLKGRIFDGKLKTAVRKCVGRKLLIADAILIALAGTTYAVNAHQYNHKFLSGTTINGIDVSDKTVDETKALLEPVVENYSLTLKLRDNKTETIPASSIDFRYTPGDELDKLLNEQNSFAWIKGALGGKEDLTVTTPVSYQEEKLNALTASFPEFQEANMTAPVNAKIAIGEDNSVSITPEVEGDQLNQDKVQEILKTSLSQLKTEVDLDQAGAYNEPTVRKDDKELQSHFDDVKGFLATTITFQNPDGTTQVLDATTTKTWLKEEDGTGYLYVDPDTLRQRCAEWAQQWAAADDNYGYFRTFRSTNYGIVRIKTSDLHGHVLDQAKTADTIYQDLINRAGKVTHEPAYSKYEDAKSAGLGGTYVEVDVDSQHVYIYQNHELVFDTSCVTGREYKTPTPSGIFAVYMKETDAALTGAMKADGTPSYVSYVDYWMPFYEGYGLHDASWRDEFGGKIYRYSGSHGCVNLPPSAADDVFRLVEKGTPVVVFRESEQADPVNYSDKTGETDGANEE